MPKIRSFVEQKFNLSQSKSFQIANKIEVNGAGAAPIYNWLRNATHKFDKVKWNFNTGFLVDRSGNVKRYDSFTWSNMTSRIQKLINVQSTTSPMGGATEADLLKGSADIEENTAKESPKQSALNDEKGVPNMDQQGIAI